MYLELEDIINSLKREMAKEKGLKNRVLYEQAIKALDEIKERKM
ncbi:MAG: hypothetical protein WCY27_03550 [archaeon]|jgi:hypothetical protein|nr:hypothetical protein [Candidatus ainarchaeum sp.]MDD3084553.1 hypothetical protein [Candidatus ainarchaeum sp.]MDD4221277.1 hypothetical protein [Candidatus ainarchaeum sp.]MDD4662790.1 hypothetical protein [Candidatus ainarchaeum sp.]